MKIIKQYWFLLFMSVILFNCKKSFAPPEITAANNYLVVDGFINANTNDVTSIKLSRSRNLVDTVVNIPELKAQVIIESNAGNTYALSDMANFGTYNSNILNLNTSNQYRLKITTSDGHQYISDYVPVKISPPIDSLTWRQDSSLTVFIYSHDPNNTTHYYKWDFVETWENYAPVQRFWVVNNGLVSYADTTNQTDSCWTTANSTFINTGTSVALSQDVISRAPITTVLQNDIRIKTRYSILVRQIPQTLDAYNYWTLIEKNSQQLGTLFDPQPSQLTGNIHPLTNPNEPVIGYVSAATTQQKRLFISNGQLNQWSKIIDHQECNDILIATNPSNAFIYNYSDTSYTAFYFTGSNPPALFVTRKVCVDCREYGGVNVRPSFW